MDLIGHEADWRGGLRWMAGRYPQYFNPPNPRVDRMAGCGAYSGDERPIDAEKFKKMAFRINWKLSDDFPYMGMFIPPVKSVDENWTRSCDEPRPPGKADTISCRQMNDYAHWMRQHGFHVLSYFNVTEFGKNMQDRDVSKLRADDPALWKDPWRSSSCECPTPTSSRRSPPATARGSSMSATRRTAISCWNRPSAISNCCPTPTASASIASIGCGSTIRPATTA